MNIQLNSRVDYAFGGGAKSLCSLRAGLSGDYNFTVDYNGSDITGYQLTSYTGGDPAMSNCTRDNKRVHTSAAAITASGGVINLGRHPIGICLVLDKSGSMSLLVPAAPSGTPVSGSRWVNLVSAVNDFVNLWEALGVNSGTAGGTSVAADVLAMVFFDTAIEAVDMDPSTPGVPWKLRGTVPKPWSLQVESLLMSRSPGTMTALGGALQLARSLTDTILDKDPIIIVVTDGKQNQMPMLNIGPGDVVSLGSVALRDVYPPILTVGYALNDSSMELLDLVSKQTLGRSRLTFEDIAGTLSGMLVEAAKGNTLSVLANIRGSVGPGEVANTTMHVDGQVQRVVAVLRWNEPAEGRQLTLGLQAPRVDGEQPQEIKPDDTRHGPRFIMQRYERPASAAAGDWTFMVRNSGEQSGLPYSLSVYSAETKLDYRFLVDPAAIAVGDDIRVILTLGYGGQPVSGLSAGAVTILAAGPGGSLGTLLHELEVNGEVLAGATDDMEPYERKIEHLLHKGSLDKLLGAGSDSALTLSELSPGRYEARLSGTETPGTYSFALRLDFTAPDGNKIRRIESAQTILRVAPDGEATQIAAPPKALQYAALVVTPRDRFGNYLGPGYADRLRVTVDGAPATASITDPQQRGIYTIELTGVPAGSNPQVGVGLVGVGAGEQPFVSGALDVLINQAGSPGGSVTLPAWPMWIWILLAVFILFFILLLVLRKKTV